MIASTLILVLATLSMTPIIAKPINGRDRYISDISARTQSQTPTNAVNIGGQEIQLASYSGDPNTFNGGSLKQSRGSGNTIIETKETVVCRQTQVEIIQQRLAILQEIMRQVVTTLTCDVETQTLVIEQFRGSVVQFSDDVRRVSTSSKSSSVSFDKTFADQISKIMDSTGAVSSNDLGLKGTDLGKGSVYVSSNWNPTISPANVDKMTRAAQSAILGNSTCVAGGSDRTNSTAAGVKERRWTTSLRF